MVVQACGYAQEYESEFTVPHYYSRFADSKCKYERLLENDIQELAIKTKFLTQYFDPRDYSQDGLHYLVQYQSY